MSPGSAILSSLFMLAFGVKGINIYQYTFILILNSLHRRKFMALPSDKNDKYFTGSCIFYLICKFVLLRSPSFLTPPWIRLHTWYLIWKRCWKYAWKWLKREFAAKDFLRNAFRFSYENLFVTTAQQNITCQK